MGVTEAVVGIDIGETNTVFGIVDRQGSILAGDTVATNQFDETHMIEFKRKHVMNIIFSHV